VRWTAVVNPAAGRGRTKALLPRLRRAFDEHDVPVHVSTDVDDAQRLARVAFTRGEGVVACGGDGTVSGIAGVAAKAGAPLAIVPTGAGNDLARQLGLEHKHALDAIALLDTGRLATIDLGRACTADGTEYAFTTVANTGFDAEANRWANGVRWITGTALYVLAVLRTLAVYRPRPVHVRVDDTEWRGDAWLVAVGNTRWYAGGMMITPGAELDDGLLDVCVIGAVPTTEFLVKFPKVFNGTHTAIDAVTTFRGKAIELLSPATAEQPMELWASGERVGQLPARVETLPRALDVLVPAVPRYVTVIVACIPWLRCPSTLQ
jgi:diacylglycerol kinase (ATP)